METENKKISWTVENGDKEEKPPKKDGLRFVRLPFLLLFFGALIVFCYLAFISFVEVFELAGKNADFEKISAATWPPALFLAAMVLTGYIYKILKGGSAPLKTSLLVIIALVVYFSLGWLLYKLDYCPSPADYPSLPVQIYEPNTNHFVPETHSANNKAGFPEIISCPIMIMLME